MGKILFYLFPIFIIYLGLYSIKNEQYPLTVIKGVEVKGETAKTAGKLLLAGGLINLGGFSVSLLQNDLLIGGIAMIICFMMMIISQHLALGEALHTQKYKNRSK